MTKTVAVRATFFNNIHHLPLLDDMKAGIQSALTKLSGEVGSVMLAWEIIPDSLRLVDEVDVFFTIKLSADKKSASSFASGLSLVKAFGFERVTIRVLSIV